MAITFGPKLGLMNNAAIGETYYDQFRQFLQAIDQLVQMSVISTALSVPPTSPANGDAYLLLSGTPSGAWLGQFGQIAVWDTQVTNAGTNVTNPAWVFYTPKPGWMVWVVASAGLSTFNGTIWQTLASGTVPVNSGGTGAVTAPAALINLGAAASGANADITGLAAIPGTTIQGISAGTPGLDIIDGTGTAHVFADTTTNGGQVVLTNATQTTSLTAQGLTTNAITVNTGNVVVPAGNVTSGTLLNTTLGAGIAVTALAGGGANSTVLIITGNGTLYQNMLAFTSYATQTTIGSAGGASALPATPSGYIPIVVNGTNFIIPYYKAS